MDESKSKIHVSDKIWISHWLNHPEIMKVCHENNYLYIHLNTVIVGCIDKAIKENKNMGSATEPNPIRIVRENIVFINPSIDNTKIAYTAFEIWIKGAGQIRKRIDNYWYSITDFNKYKKLEKSLKEETS